MLSPEEMTNKVIKRETRTDVFLNSFLGTKRKIRQEFTSRSDGNRKNSPTRHHHVALHSPLEMRRLFLWESLNPLRETKSTEFSIVSKVRKESKKVSTSTPDLVMEEQKSTEELNSELNYRNNFKFHKRNRFSREMCYYNMELARIILNCIILAIGLVYFASATMMISYKEISSVVELEDILIGV
ncbi:uncharacterized protein LOC127284525 [Leptopilina boulardi]|uniref:uncharacterized protein LOC127284525 n=1 Tax=Leptopilina boulardi TaxID=63433 RepID=UPI0021F64117|nr:uncharacterized protein LOC127284525 [Leptopilina boulardi]